MRTPIKYFGGKYNQLNEILGKFPHEDTYDKYLEPFGGSGVVLLNKPKKQIEIWNDLDSELYSFYFVLKHPVLFEKFKRMCELSFYHEGIRKELKESTTQDVVEKAYSFWYINKTSFNGNGGFSQNFIPRKKLSRSVSDFLSAVDNLDVFVERWREVFVYDRDAISLIKKFDVDGFMFYLDPPYLHETRKSDFRYTVDQPIEFHEVLVDTLKNVKKAKVLLSGYDSNLYNQLNWDCYEYKSRDSKSIEKLWFNY